MEMITLLQRKPSIEQSNPTEQLNQRSQKLFISDKKLIMFSALSLLPDVLVIFNVFSTTVRDKF